MVTKPLLLLRQLCLLVSIWCIKCFLVFLGPFLCSFQRKKSLRAKIKNNSLPLFTTCIRTKPIHFSTSSQCFRGCSTDTERNSCYRTDSLKCTIIPFRSEFKSVGTLTLQACTTQKTTDMPSLPWKSCWSLMERLWNSLKATNVLPLLKLFWGKRTTKKHLLYRWLHRGLRRLWIGLLGAFPNLKLLVIKRDIFCKGKSSAWGKPNCWLPNRLL